MAADWRGITRERLTTWGVIDGVRTARHAVRTRGGRTDRRLVDDYLAQTPSPRLHLGCGTRLFEGWLNSDFSPRTAASVRIDATKPLPFDDDVFDHVYSEHMIEHLDHLAALRLLRELRRVLRPGGRVRISTPDLGRLLDLFDAPDGLTDVQRRYCERIIAEHVPGVDPASANPVFVLSNNMREWGHRILYDRSTFRDMLEDAGFVDVTEHGLQDSDDPELVGLANEERMPTGLVDFETMTFEAVAP